MATIKFVFEDLCAFFTADPTRLIVGLISTDDAPAPDVHRPRITIKQAGQKQTGQFLRQYSGFEQIYGGICLDLFPSGAPLNRYLPPSSTDPRKSLNLLVEIDKDLYREQSLKHDIEECRAQLQFMNGTVYTLDPIPVRFVDEKTGQPHPNAPTEAALKVGLDVEILAGGYAVLHFKEAGIEDFIFKGDQDFEVEVTNAADNKQLSHFKYLYNIVHPTPDPLWIPTDPPPKGGVRPRDGDPRCLTGGYGDPPPPPPPEGDDGP